MHHTTNVQLQQEWNNLFKNLKVMNLWNKASRDVCWWKQCFKGNSACVSVDETAKTNIRL